MFLDEVGEMSSAMQAKLLRVLENVLMKAVALCRDKVLTPDLLPADLYAGDALGEFVPPATAPGLVSLGAMEQEHVARVLEATGWHRVQACDILGVSRRRLRRMIRQNGLNLPPGMDGGEDEAQDEEAD
ncbi:MAG: sigma 54-interacting transcriptional regulator [Chromatiaceae bacterium]|nr:sigma 54-interacting transcriptional regulator [Chromatiaceae bacterium]